MTEKSVQERFAPDNICFGCGPANPKGCASKFPPRGGTAGRVEARTASSGLPGVAQRGDHRRSHGLPLQLGGGAAPHGEAGPRGHLPSTVTAQYAIKLRKPTPSDRMLTLRARVVSSEGNRAEVEASVEADGEVCATCRGTFVSVQARPSRLPSLVALAESLSPALVDSLAEKAGATAGRGS